MSILHSDASKRFREEVRAFCEARLPAYIRAKVELNAPLDKSDHVRWQKILFEQGWIAGHWPKAFGGLDWDPLRRYIFLEETLKIGAPKIAPFGVSYVGPVIYTFGTPEQKARFLPAILRSDTWWCQGYSEPGAGSDLAALSTRAVARDGVYVVNGQKTWTTSAHYADMMFCLVRTGADGKRQDGISFLLIDMKSPGITVRPIVTLDQCHELNDVFFDDVKVPAANLVGEEGKGWTYAKFLLGNERLGAVGYVGQARRMLRRLRALSHEIMEGGRALAQHREFQAAYTRLEMDLQVLDAMCVRQLHELVAGKAVGNQGSLLKLRGAAILQAIGQMFAELLGRVGLPYRMSSFEEPLLDAAWGDADNTGLIRQHLIGRAVSIFGGSTEVQRNILAKAALDL